MVLRRMVERDPFPKAVYIVVLSTLISHLSSLIPIIALIL
jgi:hypothetical protein